MAGHSAIEEIKGFPTIFSDFPNSQNRVGKLPGPPELAFFGYPALYSPVVQPTRTSNVLISVRARMVVPPSLPSPVVQVSPHLKEVYQPAPAASSD